MSAHWVGACAASAETQEASAYCTLAKTGLEYLSLQGNALTGQIPSCLLATGMSLPLCDSVYLAMLYRSQLSLGRPYLHVDSKSSEHLLQKAALRASLFIGCSQVQEDL